MQPARTWLNASWREIAIGAVVAALFGLMAQTLLLRRAMAEENAQASRTAATLAAGLRSEIDKFELVTTALSTDREARDLLAAPDAARAGVLNRRLSSLRDALGASVIYLMDRRGDTLVASNWQQRDSFVGQNYRFRSYFRDALAAGEQRQFALGTRSRIPGLYLARRIGDGRAPLGVMVVKIRFDALERDWRSYPGTVFATGPDGVILITDDPARRFRTVHPLTGARRAQLRQQLDFGTAPLDLDPELGGRRSAGGFVEGVVAAGPGLVLHVLQPVRAARRGAIAAAWLATAALFSVLAAALLIARSRQQALRLAVERGTAQRIELLKDELAQANRLALLGQVAAGVGHEIGQPVSAIVLQADTGRQLSAAGDLAGAAQAFTRIGELTGRITAITRELRQFARRSARSGGPAAIDEAIGGALLLLSDRIVQTGTQIVRGGTAGLAVQADPQRCEQILVNLLQNALDAAAERGGAVIGISAGLLGGMVTVDVTDNGPGLDDAARATLFQPFKTSKPSGLGLGLVISQDIAHDLGGALVLVDTPAGARFRLTLPVAGPKAGPISLPMAGPGAK